LNKLLTLCNIIDHIFFYILVIACDISWSTFFYYVFSLLYSFRLG